MLGEEPALTVLLERFRAAGVSADRTIPLLESATVLDLPDGHGLFEQFYPANEFYLLIEGTAKQVTTGKRTGLVHRTTLDWPFAALGWSGFLPPHRYGSSYVAKGHVRALSWSHRQLAEIFYVDPSLAIVFLTWVLGSASRQLKQLVEQHSAESKAGVAIPEIQPLTHRRPVVGRADSCLRRSAFFAPFDEPIITALSNDARLESYRPGEEITSQDAPMEGLYLLASGSCQAYFQRPDNDVPLLPYRRFANHVGIIAGAPQGEARYLAEASIYAESHCWVYVIPAASIARISQSDPEFGRAFNQRLLIRLAGLIGALQVTHDASVDEPESTLVKNLIENSQARIPVTSDLFKVPHLLSHPLTVANAMAVLNKVAETGRYSERLVANRSVAALDPLVKENAFYQDIVAACAEVIESPDDLDATVIRERCDRAVAAAFEHVHCEIRGHENLPDQSGQIFVLNHLACPEYYMLPNGYHFSFDTGFVSSLLWRHYGVSPTRVIRESPGAEFGHNLFYKRLAHITVPTIESGVEALNPEEFAALRRAASTAFLEQGMAEIAAGNNVIICPEGQSQPMQQSPARFHTGAFRLALEAKAKVVPIALAGFHRRFKDGPLIALVESPIDVHAMMAAYETDSVRVFADILRTEFSTAVKRAAQLADAPYV